MRHDVELFVVVTDRVRTAARQILLAHLRHRLFPGGLASELLPQWRLERLVIGLATRSAIGMDLAADHALHPPDLVLVHVDDRVGRVAFASGARTESLDLSPYFIDIFIEDGVHPFDLS